MSVLIDSSVWIEYFRGSQKAEPLDFLIDENLIVINDLILAELLPGLYLCREQRLISLLREVKRLPISVDWDNLITMRTDCLREGINRVGIPDLIIAQQAIRNRLNLYSFDRHFRLLAGIFPLDLY
ncbi:MAG: PIN domain-containing protein [Candidatus Erginobacter occultus]|nr:PIN domain-containing protein [Candidatus Erginobacter occultus]